METKVAITTFDNPFNPFTQFEQWFLFDIEKGYGRQRRLRGWYRRLYVAGNKSLRNKPFRKQEGQPIGNDLPPRRWRTGLGERHIHNKQGYVELRYRRRTVRVCGI